MIKRLALCAAIVAAIPLLPASAQTGLGTPAALPAAPAQPGPGAPPGPGGRPSGPPRWEDLGKTFPPVGPIEKIADNLYLIGGQGGNTVVWVYSSGVLLVDVKFPGNGAKIRDLVRTVTDRPITHIIDTHVHPDHTGSNGEFGPGIEIIAQERTAARMAKLSFFQAPAMKAALPNRTFKDSLTLFKGKDRVEVRYLGLSHTDGDTVVIFPAARTMDVGDLMKDKVGPSVDASNGGSGVSYPATLARAAAVRGVDRIITGHGARVLPRQDLVRAGELSRLLLDHERAMFAAGKSVKETFESFVPPERYKDIPLTGLSFMGVQEVEATFNELRSAAARAKAPLPAR